MVNFSNSSLDVATANTLIAFLFVLMRTWNAILALVTYCLTAKLSNKEIYCTFQISFSFTLLKYASASTWFVKRNNFMLIKLHVPAKTKYWTIGAICPRTPHEPNESPHRLQWTQAKFHVNIQQLSACMKALVFPVLFTVTHTQMCFLNVKCYLILSLEKLESLKTIINNNNNNNMNYCYMFSFFSFINYFLHKNCLNTYSINVNTFY